MDIGMDHSLPATWYPDNIVIFEKNLFSRNAIVDAVEKIYPESNVFCFDCIAKTMKFITGTHCMQHTSLAIIEFSGDKNSPLLFFNTMSVHFSAQKKHDLKVLVYTSVEDRFFISSMTKFISGGIVFKSEPVLSMLRVLYAIGHSNGVVLSAKARELLASYKPQKSSCDELRGYFSEIGEHRLSLSSRRIDSKYKTFYSRRYNTIAKIGCKNVRQYSRYLSKIVGQLSE
ncbi:hypothetical protein [Serratia aquatilis]|uniref:Uncharacterized protein n=1 Tax=Serratia aquatilis TaxID=1737515 RepID=A0ABV6EAV2_9GAMM